MSAFNIHSGKKGFRDFPAVLFGVSFVLGGRRASDSILSFRYPERVIWAENFFSPLETEQHFGLK